MFVQVRDIKKSYTKMGEGIFKSGKTLVLKGIDFDIEEGDCIGIIGESGSGKSTLRT